MNRSRRRFRADVLDEMRISPGSAFPRCARFPSASRSAGVVIWLFRRCNSPVRFSPARTSITILRGVESARTVTSSSARSRNVPRGVPVSIQGPRSACTAAPNSTSSNGFFKKLQRAISSAFRDEFRRNPGRDEQEHASPAKHLSFRRKMRSRLECGGSKSRMISSGFCSSAARRASANDRTA